ncbi:MAG TPA: glutamate-5-semialdehyde dehydrogenase [Phycisphaerae bacterium]|nr:glutamate-5-semialdehyde dehydrogenase [Phycisphaerae bacterium]
MQRVREEREVAASGEAVAEMVRGMGVKARAAARGLAGVSGGAKNAALQAMAELIWEKRGWLMEENGKDVAAAEKEGLAGPLVARLKLPEKKVEAMARGLREIALQVDPVGQTIEAYDRPNGLRVEKRRVPIGVVAIIFESRPNVTADAAGICLKSGNACILRGGKEAIHSNKAIAQIVREAVKSAGLPEDAVQLVETTDRAAVGAMATAEGLIDLIIPRGGEGLIRSVVEQATIPVIKHYKGVCHVYIDKGADADMAVKIAVSAKVDGVALCNTEECLLVHKEMAGKVLPRIATAFREKKVEMRADQWSLGLLQDAKLAKESDWGTEFLDYVIAIRQVGSIDEAIEHIAKYGSQHTDAIVTNDLAAARKFVTEVDSASVLVNASTRFADGGEYGLGAEIGISTDKLHARGPMGAADLCTYKYIVTGSGQVRG